MPRSRLVIAYIVLVGLPVLCILGVLKLGQNLTLSPVAPTPAGNGPAAATEPVALPRLLLQIVVIIVLARVVGAVFRRLNQPQVVGEMAAGILLGPSILGAVVPGISAALFPATSLDYLNALSQIGVILFMFLVGLSLDPGELHKSGHVAVLTSHVSIAMPFCLGSVTALFLYPRFSNAGVTFSGFALFMGAAMSITAFPVLARILSERKMLGTELGSLAITCAAVDDVTGWCVLAYIVVLVRASHTGVVWFTVGGATLYSCLLIFVIRRKLRFLEDMYLRDGRLSDGALTAIVLLLLASALCTEYLGVHMLFGAFLLGAIMPKRAEFVAHLKEKLEPVTVALFFPLFFAYSGLRTSFGAVAAHGTWMLTIIVVILAVAGKLGGCLAAGRFAGVPWRDATALGILMNTRGLMQLVILNIGMDIGVISPTVFSMMVLVAMLTTLMTTPLLDLTYSLRLTRIRSQPLPSAKPSALV